MFSWKTFNKLSLHEKVNAIYLDGTFIVSIRYYAYKVNLFLIDRYFVEVFINHKKGIIEKVDFLDQQHSRMKFYCDQIQIPAY
jgi:hypothetical protein